MPKTIPLGGQALIEGVMIKSPSKVAMAARTPEGKIVSNCYNHQTLTQRYKILNIPFVRGAVSLFEMMIVGMNALTWSANQQGDEERERLGFVIISEGKKLYFMGDSVYMPQLSKMKPDVLLIAVGGTFTQTPEEAAKDADVIEPNYAIPMCWGFSEGSRDNAELFKDLAKVPVKVLSPGESLDF